MRKTANARNTRSVHVALCGFDSSRVGRCHCIRRRNVFISHVAVCGKPQCRNWKFLFLFLSVPFYAHSPVALVNIFRPRPVKRNGSLYTRRVARERGARMVTYGHARSHAFTRTDTHAIHEGVRHDWRNEEEKDLASSLFETNFRQRDETLQDFCLRDTHGTLTVR